MSAFEKIIERLEEERHPEIYGGWETMRIDKAIEIVNQVTEEFGKDTNATTDGFIFTKEDVQKIINCKKRRLDDLEHCWNEFTRHMECGEIRELKESCIDDEIIIHILSEWLLKDVPDINVGENEEFCEWFKYDYRTIAPKNHDAENPYWRMPENLDKIKYCPYCGKEIKVVE